MFKPIPEEELRKAGIKEPQICFKVQYTYLRNELIKPTVDCWLPPVGWVFDYLEKKWVYTGVHKRSPDKTECYWEIDPRFSDYKKYWENWEYEEEDKRKKDPAYNHPNLSKTHNEIPYLKTKSDLAKFKKECWRNRLGGFWFSNNGFDTYLTGTHWMYLSVHKLDTGAPKYRKKDKLLHYFWEYCEEDPDCFGTVYIDKRRGGKTFISGNIALEKTTRKEQFHTGIQSKTEEDARKSVFNKAIIKPFKKYPKFFRPVSNLPKGNTIPASGLIFNSGKMSGREEELESFIDYKQSGAIAYDGEKLNFGIFDEEGKTTETSVYDRWLVVKYCFLDDEANIIGKSFHTTTVEEMDAGGRPFLKLWKESDLGNRKGKQTISGLYKFFLPSYMSRHIDKYGECDEEANKAEIREELEQLKNNPRALSSKRRKEPFCEEDAFSADASSCVFDPIKIEDQINALQFLPRLPYKRGNFHWKDGVHDGEVIFIDNPNGRFMICWEPPDNKRNLQLERLGTFHPGATEQAVAGVDTYDHRKLRNDTETKLSMGSLCIIKKEDPFNPTEFDGVPVCGYLFRPDNPDVFYQDVLMALKYYGCLALVETNKPGLQKYLEDKGYEGYSAMLPGKTERGINNSGTSAINNYIGELIEQYIATSIERTFFIDLVEQFKDFTPENTTAFDFCMSFGYALMLLKSSISRINRTQSTADIGDYLSFMRS